MEHKIYQWKILRCDKKWIIDHTSSVFGPIARQYVNFNLAEARRAEENSVALLLKDGERTRD